MENRISREEAEKLDKEMLITLLLSMQDTAETFKEQAECLEIQLADMNHNLKILMEQFQVAQNHRYGRSSEKMKYQTEEYEQLNIFSMYDQCFNEAEHTVENTEDTEEINVKGYKKKKTKGKRDADLSGLPHAEPVVSELSHEELVELLGENYKRMPDEVYRHLEFHPGTFEVQEYHVAVYKSADGERFAHAKRPTADLLKNSIASPSLVAAILNYKYVNGLPVYRLEQEFHRSGVEISRQVMCNWVIRVAERYLSLVYDRMKRILLNQAVIQADETTVEVTKDGRKAGSKSYMWVYSTGEYDSSGKRVVLYDYRKTRATEHLKDFLGEYSGILVSDGYQSYHTLEKEKDDLTVAGCYAHARRHFANAVKARKRSIRPFCIGRKNWLMIDTIAGAEASAIVYSIAETAKANNLKPYEYFKYLLTEIPKYQDEKSLTIFDEFLPWSESLPSNIRKPKKQNIRLPVL